MTDSMQDGLEKAAFVSHARGGEGERAYLNFDLFVERLSRDEDAYRAWVWDGQGDRLSATFRYPLTQSDLDDFLRQLGRPRRRAGRDDKALAEAKKIGQKLFAALFQAGIEARFRQQLAQAQAVQQGLRLRLRIDPQAAELHDLPWEYLYDASRNRFLSFSTDTPVTRYLELQEPARAWRLTLPLRVLVVVASPKDLPRLDVEDEWERLQRAFASLAAQGQVVVERLQPPTLDALRAQLRRKEYHVLHFIGHGSFTPEAADGQLALEDTLGCASFVSGQDLGYLLHDRRALRLVVLNACEGGRTGSGDPFAGVAHSLVQQGLPAVIAMQFEITDDAARQFTQGFYEALLDGGVVDSALAEARKAIYFSGNHLEWGTPVLFSRMDGRVFEGGGAGPDALATPQAVAAPQPAASQPTAPRSSEKPHSVAASRVDSAPRLDAASLTLTLSAEPNPAPVDAEVIWTATARNPGAQPARHLELLRGKNWLHEEESFDLPPGGGRAFSFSCRYADPGEYTETVRLLSRAAPVEALGQVRVVQPAGFSLRLSPSLERVEPKQPMTWTVEVHNDGGEALQQMRLRLGSELLGEPFDLPRGEKKTLSFGRTYAQPGEALESVRAAAFTPAGERLARQADGKLLVAALPPKPAPRPAVDENAPPLRLTLAPGVFLDLQRVPAGEFLMGGDPKKDSQAQAYEQPQHKVYLDEYFMGKYPITVAQFAVFIKATRYQTTAEKKGSGRGWTGSQWDEIKGASWQFPRGPGSDVQQKADHPVTQVSWEDAAAFCEWASIATGKPLRLPTEAEWEKAARGTDGRIYPWGDAAPDAQRCNFGWNVGDTTQVGRYSPQGDSPYGCADMAGNVWDWCSDWYADKYYASSPRENPKGPASGQYRALRGGSWDDDGNDVRASNRYGFNPSTQYDYTGFRCAFSP